MEDGCFNVTNELKMQDFKYGMFPNGKLHSIDYNSRRDSSTCIFYCDGCEYQRTMSYRHQKTVLKTGSNSGHHSSWTRTFKQLQKLSRTTFNLPYFAARFLNYIIYFIAVLSRLLSSWKYSCKGTFLHYVLIFYGVILLSTHSLGEEVTFMSQGQGKLLDSFVPVGTRFVYTIPNRTFDCDIDRLEVSEGSSRILPQWLAFDETKQQFYGVPSAKDTGSYEILVVALANSGSETGKICGMKAFTIYVSSEDKRPSFAGPVLKSVSVGAGSSETLPSKASKHFVCVPGLQAVFATVIISADMHELGGHERMAILQGMAQHMNISSSRVALFHHEDGHPLISQLENPSMIVSGSGDGRYKKGPKSILTWKISCGALRLGPTYLTELETSAQDGTISNAVGYPVVGWHVTSGVQKARHRARRAVAGTPTPTATAILPTQVKNISTVLITESISLTTAFVTPNSTLMPSTSLSSTLQAIPTVSVLMSSTFAVNSTRNFTSSMPTTSPTLDTVAVTSTPVLSSLNLTTIFKSVSSFPTVNISSQVNTSSIPRTVNIASTSVVSSTVFENTSVVAASSVTSVNATSVSSSPVLNSTSVLEMENSTVSVFNSSNIMTSTVVSITPSPSIFLPGNSSAIVNSTFSTLLPGTNFSTASLNLTQTASFFTSSVPPSLSINDSSVTSVLPSTTTTVMSSSVTMNSTVFMNQTSTIQPSFQTSSFYPSPTMSSSLTVNATNLTSSASLMVFNTSFVIPSSTSNTTDEVVKTSMVNSSSLVSLVQTLSTVPIITSINISSTALLTTVTNTSHIDATSHASSLVGNTSVLSVTLSTLSPNATRGPDMSTNISRVLPSTSWKIRNMTSSSSVILSTVFPNSTSGLEASTNASQMASTLTVNTSSFVYPTTSFELNLTSVTSTIYLTNLSTVVFNSTILQTASVNKTMDWSSTVGSDWNITTIQPIATTTTQNSSSSLLTITETMNASTSIKPSIELSRTVDLISANTTVLPSFTTINTTLSATFSIDTGNVSSTGHVLTSFATVSTLTLNSTLHDSSIVTKLSSIMVNSSATSTVFPSINSTLLLQPSPMTSRFPSSFVNSSVTNASEVFGTEFVSSTASLVQNYSSSTVTTLNTTSILSDNRTSFSQISPTLITTNMTRITSTQNESSRFLGPTSTLIILNSTIVLPNWESSIVPSSSVTQVNLSSTSVLYTSNWSSMITPNVTSSPGFSVVRTTNLQLPYSSINTSGDLNSTAVVSGVSSSPIFSTPGVLPSSTDNVTMTTVSPSSVVMETQTPYPNVTTRNVSTVPLSPSLNTSYLVVSSSSVVMETESTVVIETLTPYPTVSPSNTSTVPLSSSLTLLLNTSSLFVSSSDVVMKTESTVVIETLTPYPTVSPSNTSTVPLSSSLTLLLNTSSLFVSSSDVVMETESTVVIETLTPYPTVSPSNTSTVPLSSSLTPLLNTSSLFVSSSDVVMETESTVVIETPTPYPTVTPSNTSMLPLSSSLAPLLSSSFPVVTSSSVSPNYTSDILNVTTTTPLIEETLAPNASSLVLTKATVIKSSSPIVLPSTPLLLTSSALVTSSLSTKIIPSSSITNSTVDTRASVYLESSTLTVPSLNATTIVVTPTTFSPLSSSNLLEETATVLTSNTTTPYFTTATTSLVSSVQPSSTFVLTSSPQAETTALQTSSVFNTSVFSTSMLSLGPSLHTSLPVSTSLVTSVKSTVLAPSSTWMENSTVVTPFTSDLPQTSSSPISSIVISSTEASTVSLVARNTTAPTTATPNKPPQLHNDIGRLSATAGKVFRYAIPADVFYDEDGNTTSLTLTLKHINEEFTAEDLGNDSWLVFDAEKQEMYGLPMEKDIPSDPERGKKFLLAAKDSAGLIGYDVFEIMIRKSSIAYAYTQSISIRLDNDFTAFERNLSQRLDLVSRISRYYGDSDTSQVRVLSYSEGSILFSWTNDSLPSDVCNTTEVNYVAEKVVGREGVTTAFKESLSPEYSVTSANRTLTGVCNATTLPPPLVPDKAVGTEPSGLWEKHVLPGIIVAIILIIIAVLLLLLFLRRRQAKPKDPEKRTYKKRKPIILEPEMEMKPRSGKPLILENDELSQPPSYMSEMSLDKTLYYDSDDYDEEDYKPTPSRSSPVYETPPPEYNIPREPLEQPPPAYRLPPTFYSSYTLPPWETSSDV